MKYYVMAHPYAVSSGAIDVPDDCADVERYIGEHFDEIKFGEPDLDYDGTYFEFGRDEE